MNTRQSTSDSNNVQFKSGTVLKSGTVKDEIRYIDRLNIYLKKQIEKINKFIGE